MKKYFIKKWKTLENKMIMIGHKLHILESNYWEHYKFAKELSMFLPHNHKKRVYLEKTINEMLLEINKLKTVK